MKAIGEGDDRGASRGITSNLNCVLDRLCTAIEKKGFFGEVTRGELHNTLSQRNIRLIHHDAKASVCKLSGLLYDGLCHLWAGVPNIHDTDATCKVNVTVPVYIFDNRAVSLGCEDAHRRSDAPRYELLTPRQQFTRFRSGNVKIR